MPIFDQGYQHWNGTLSGHAWRWWTISRRGLQAQRGALALIISAMAVIPALGLTVTLVFWGLFEQKAEVIQPLVQWLRLPQELSAGPKAFRVPVWTVAYSSFFVVELVFAMLLVLLVGPRLISQDLRFNAVPLYLSRPVRRFDYFMGKFGVIGLCLARVTVAPAILAYILGVAFSFDLSVIKDTWRLLAGSIAYGVLIMLSAGLLMLALSSLSRNSRSVAALWLGLWFVGGVMGQILYAVQMEHAEHEYYRALTRAQGGQFRLRNFDPARQPEPTEELKQAKAKFQEAMQNNWGRMVSLTGNLDRVGDELLGTKDAWLKLASIGRGHIDPEVEMAPMLGPQYPWYWSAGVLAGLMGLSLWILSLRVKSLDRLK
jgi:ABC-2 type transport system permease protein